MSSDNLVRLARVPVELKERLDLETTYNRFHKLAIDGRIPIQRVNGGIFVDRNSYILIARELSRPLLRKR